APLPSNCADSLARSGASTRHGGQAADQKFTTRTSPTKSSLETMVPRSVVKSTNVTGSPRLPSGNSEMLPLWETYPDSVRSPNCSARGSVLLHAVRPTASRVLMATPTIRFLILLQVQAQDARRQEGARAKTP